MSGSIPRSTWIAVVVAAAALLGVVAVVAGFWVELGDIQISVAGWIAMILGVLATLALGIGLMTLVFLSSRGGYDDPGRHC